MAEELPPPYSEQIRNHVPNDLEVAPAAISQQTGNSEGTEMAVGIENASNSFSGFIDIMYKEKKLPSGFVKNMIYKMTLLIYYFANFIYSIAAVAIQREHLAYHLVYMLTSLIGLISELVVIIINRKKCLSQSSGHDTGEDMTQYRTNQVTHTSQPEVAWTPHTRVQDYYHKAKSVLDEYVFYSLGEFLIYPTLICTLYGFINERAWRFDNGISGFNFLFFLYSVIMDAFYLKVYLVHAVIRMVSYSYVKYDELLRPTVVEWKRFIAPIYLAILLAILTALTHWLMIGIIGVRTYIDNFTTDLEMNDTNSSILSTGDYRVTPYTGYMIACTVYIPILSWVVYIVLNKLWFYEVFSAINQMTTGADDMPEQDTWNYKLFAFAEDPLGYISALLLIASFVAFTVGAYLLDYDSSDDEVSSNARDAIQGLTPCFIVLFLIANIQAVIATLIAPCGLPILCISACYKCHTMY